MKFFHLSDLHIGIKLMNRDLSEDQEYLFRQIADYAASEKPQAVVIAGDIYDRAVPSGEAVSLFDRFIGMLREAVPEAEIMVISGNHDSGPRINVFRSVLARQHVHMIGLPPLSPEDYIEKVTLEDEFGEVNFYLLPFVRPSMVRRVLMPESAPEDEGYEPLSYDETLRRLIAREDIDPSVRNVLVSHQFYLPAGTAAEDVERADSEVRTVGNIDEVRTDVLAPFDYAALGHIHKPMKAGSEIYRYCGSPLFTSVSEAGQKKGIVVAELGAKTSPEAGSATLVRVLPLTPLRDVRIVRGTLEEVLREASDDYVSAVLTDETDLDFMDMQDRLHAAFPHLLEIRRENLRIADYTADIGILPALSAEGGKPDLFSMVNAFLPDLDEEEKKLLKDVINSVGESHAFPDGES